MSDSSQPKSLADLILDVLRGANGEWMTRKQIAQKIGRANGVLLPYDVTVLGTLVESGSVSMGRRSIGAVKIEHIYRVEA